MRRRWSGCRAHVIEEETTYTSGLWAHCASRRDLVAPDASDPVSPRQQAHEGCDIAADLADDSVLAIRTEVLAAQALMSAEAAAFIFPGSHCGLLLRLLDTVIAL